jgi:hypothetical protein
MKEHSVRAFYEMTKRYVDDLSHHRTALPGQVAVPV